MEINPHCLIFFGIEDDVYNVLVKKLFELWTPGKPEYSSLGRFCWGLRLFRFDSLFGNGGLCVGLGLKDVLALSQ